MVEKTLFQIVPGPALDGQFGPVRVAFPGHDDHFRFGRRLAYIGQPVQAVTVGHADIQKNNVKVAVGGFGQAFVQRQRIICLVLQLLKHGRQHAADHFVIIDNEHACHMIFRLLLKLRQRYYYIFRIQCKPISNQAASL